MLARLEEYGARCPEQVVTLARMRRGVGMGTATGVARAVAMTPETRYLRCQEFLVMNNTLFVPALALRHRSSLEYCEPVRVGNQSCFT
jgi:hypothetical protein